MKLYDIVFSPTGGTKKVADCLTGTLEGDVTTVDLTDSKQNFHAVSLTKEDVAVISVPSYGGRVPAVAVERLGMVHGNGARAVLVCVYGNRAYVPYKIGKLQIQGFSEPTTPKNKITELSHYAEGRPVKTTGGLFAWKARKEAEIF